MTTEVSDSPDLEALFDSVAAQREVMPPAPPSACALAGEPGLPTRDGQEHAFNRVGQMARQFHDALLGLGYDKLIEKTVTALPDATDRLAYVATLTELAACRVLNATDIAKPAVSELAAAGSRLGGQWDQVYANQLSVAEFQALAGATREYLQTALPQRLAVVDGQLMEIMMAQDFQDLTGQVIKKIVALAQDMETQLMGLLIDIMPELKRTEAVTGLLNGPVIRAEGRSDVVTTQGQVDDLLESLGF